MPWLLQAAPQADGSWWAMGALQPAGRRALQLEWEEPFSATYNTYKMPPTLSLRQYETQNITKESALMHHIFCLHLKCKQCDPLQVLLRQDCWPATLLDALPTHSVVYISCTNIQCAIVCVQQYAFATPVCSFKNAMQHYGILAH